MSNEPTVDDHFKGRITESKDDPGVFRDQHGVDWVLDPLEHKWVEVKKEKK